MRMRRLCFTFVFFYKFSYIQRHVRAFLVGQVASPCTAFYVAVHRVHVPSPCHVLSRIVCTIKYVILRSNRDRSYQSQWCIVDVRGNKLSELKRRFQISLNAEQGRHTPEANQGLKKSSIEDHVILR